MKYELTYKCINCFVTWREIISKQVLYEVFGSKYKVMSKDWLYLLFKNGMEMHKCNIWLNQEKIDGTTSYGNVISIRPVEE